MLSLVTVAIGRPTWTPAGADVTGNFLSPCSYGEIDFFEHQDERLGLPGEVVGGVSAEPADVSAQAPPETGGPNRSAVMR